MKRIRVTMRHDYKTSMGKILRGGTVKLPEREALALVSAGLAVQVVVAPKAPPPPPPDAGKVAADAAALASDAGELAKGKGK